MHAIDTAKIDAIFEKYDSTIGRDLKLNLKRILTDGALEPAESLPALLATATSVNIGSLVQLARDELATRDFTAEQIRESTEVAAIMAMLNIYYRTRHMLQNDVDYRTTGLRMTALAKPTLGRERFEMLAFAVSVLNGCESCIRSHEQALRQAGVSVEKTHDLIRLAAVVKGLSALEA